MLILTSIYREPKLGRIRQHFTLTNIYWWPVMYFWAWKDLINIFILTNIFWKLSK